MKQYIYIPLFLFFSTSVFAMEEVITPIKTDDATKKSEDPNSKAIDVLRLRAQHLRDDFNTMKDHTIPDINQKIADIKTANDTYKHNLTLQQERLERKLLPPQFFNGFSRRSMQTVGCMLGFFGFTVAVPSAIPVAIPVAAKVGITALSGLTTIKAFTDGDRYWHQFPGAPTREEKLHDLWHVVGKPALYTFTGCTLALGVWYLRKNDASFSLPSMPKLL